jgi:hypothetical protein
LGTTLLGGNGIFLVIIAIIAVVVTDVVGHWLRTRQLSKLKVEKQRLEKLRAEKEKLLDTAEEQRSTLSAHQRIVSTLKQRVSWTRDQIEAEIRVALTVEHEIGSKAKSRSRFRMRMIHADDGGRRKGADAPLDGLHPEISRLPNYALVWAGSEKEALHRFSVAFPPSVGIAADTPTNLDRQLATGEAGSSPYTDEFAAADGGVASDMVSIDELDEGDGLGRASDDPGSDLPALEPEPEPAADWSVRSAAR